MSISIRRFLTLSMALVCLTGTVTGVAFWYSSRYSDEATNQLVDAVESLVVTQDLQMNLSVHRRQSLLEEFRTARQRRLKIHESGLRILEDLERIPKFSSTAEEDQIVQSVQRNIRAYLNSFESLRVHGITGNNLFLELRDEYDRSQEALQDLIDINLEQTQEIEANAQEQNRLDWVLMSTSLFFLFGFIAVFIFGFRKLLYKPVINLKNTIDEFELGQRHVAGAVEGATEIQDISKSFQKLSERISRQQDLQLTFLSSIAHDLKNPLGAIKMSADILADLQSLTDEDKNVLSIISRQSDHMKRLVNDLLDTTRIESGHLEYKMAPVDIGSLLQDAVLLHSNLSTRHQLKFAKPRTPVMVWADEQRITQVINNLLNNAIKYSPNGGLIQVEVLLDQTTVTISVADSGVGISPEDLEGIFEPFRRSPATQKSIPGVGLGLAVSKKIISAHPGGSISVSSLPGKGSTFTIRLSLYKEKKTNAEGPSASI